MQGGLDVERAGLGRLLSTRERLLPLRGAVAQGNGLERSAAVGGLCPNRHAGVNGSALLQKIPRIFTFFS